jgi:hypothetical protein
MTPRDRSGRFDEDRTSDALCNTPQTTTAALRRASSSDARPSASAQPATRTARSTRCRSASVTSWLQARSAHGAVRSHLTPRATCGHAGCARPKFFRRNVSPFVPYFLYLMKADAISNTVNLSRWDRDFKMAPGPRHPYAATNYDGDNPLRLAKKIDAALNKYGLGKRTPPVEDELLATMTQQCRVRPQGLPMEMQHDHNCGGKAPGS